MKKFIPEFILSLYHRCLSPVAAFWYGRPSRKLVVIGVTGTNGKSTVVDLTHKIFAAAGYRVASASSVRFIIDDREWQNDLKMTMPGRFFLQKFLWQALQKKCDTVILEVTSEGIKQSRERAIEFDVAALTNVTPEHIESHGGFHRYLAAKKKLFRELARSRKPHKAIVINGDDPHVEQFLKFLPENAWVYGLYLKEGAYTHEVKPQTCFVRHDAIHLTYQKIDFNLRLRGEFNAYNALCALTIALSRGIDISVARAALESSGGVAGRLEYVQEKPFSVVVDYAHTPDALTKVYGSLKPHTKRLICVLGAAGGGRDKWKRPEMGKIASKFCDDIILTDEDPYDEEPASILEDIKKGIEKKMPEVLLDRKEAIATAIKKAQAGDTVIITGKGSEPWMMARGGKKIPWDDREIARKILSEVPKT
ncbi:MAG: UDP-N-acetylmuramoyl-L-alanyl-D-glutamate--2,6-diaminopimelate ligase [Candidatus Ryanbacteria bacterium]|nr:UDP-N-acetylmuramoyl-L-alanyl-D-glutamate--2,6-diaminopimelate ligase [Candidatus Ryanbacteria bacterium]